MKILTAMSIFLLLTGCGKKSDVPALPSPSLTKPKTYSILDANNAFDAFNSAFYDANRKLYYSKSDRKDLAVGWPQAVFWDISMAAYKRSKSAAHLKLLNDIFQGAAVEYSNFDWKKVKEVNDFIYDDMMWWIISLARAYELTHDQKHLDAAIAGFNYVWDNSYDPVNGGMRWSWKVEGKNACINYPTVIGAMTLFNITKNQDYLDKAKNIYSWSRTNLFQTSTGRVADHKVGNNPPGFEDYTYNQGTFIGAAVMLFKATGDQVFLTEAKSAADYTKNKMSDAKGVLPAEGEWNEQGVLKAIFAQYMQMLIVDAGQSQYNEWMHYNINLAWANRDQQRILMFRDYKIACPTGVIQSYEASSGVAFMQLFDPVAN